MKNKNPMQSNSANKPIRLRYIFASRIFVLLIISVLVFIMFLKSQKSDPASEAKIREITSRYLYYKTQRETYPNMPFLDLLRNQKLAKDPNKLTDEDFLKVEGITLGHLPTFSPPFTSMELCDIKLLKKFTNLKSLNIGYVSYPPNKIPRWMSLLGKIGIVNLEEKYSLDLTPLKKLNNIDNLLIYDTSVRNFKIMKNLSNLRELTLVHTNISNLEPLKGLENLNFLVIRDCNFITDEQIDNLQKALPELKIDR